MKELHKLDSYTIEILQTLIDDKIEESINIEYKSGDALQKTPGKKKELAKDISAMANADGGLIIYGIEEVNHVPTGFKYVDGNYFTKESLEHIISTTIKRGIQKIIIHPIRVEDKISKSVYVVQIPASDDSPHMNNLDNRFYVRRNFESIPMEEYEIRNSYYRKQRVVLDFDSLTFSPDAETRKTKEFQKQMCFKFTVSIKNIGNTMTDEYRLNACIISNLNCTVHYPESGQSKNYSFTDNDDSVKVTNEKPPRIFPGEKLDLLTFFVTIDSVDVFDFFETLTIRRELMFQNEKIEKTSPDDELRKAVLDDLKNQTGNFDFLNNWNTQPE